MSHPLPRRTLASAGFRSTFAVGLLGLAACGSSAEAEIKPWNVLLITLDTTRADRLGCYGYNKARTPVIDDLADTGLRFERAISTAGITPMSHSSILTGLNNYKHGMRVFHSETVSHRLKDEVETLPEILQDRGWRTGAAISAYPVSEHYNLNQGFESFESGVVDVSNLSLETQQSHSKFWSRGGATDSQRCGDQTIDDAIDFVGPAASEQPWCLWVHLFDVHDYSVVPPADFLDKLGVDCPAPNTFIQGQAQHQWREQMYDPELAFIDQQLGRLVKHLDDIGERDQTVIVITADHGQGLLDGLKRHGWSKHRLLYDWSLRVPMIVNFPGSGASIVSDQVRTIDVLPTLLDTLGIPALANIEGRSMLPLVAGESEPSPRIAYADALNLHDSHSPSRRALKQNYDNLYCATDGIWKLIWHQTNPQNSELFHLAEDPLELNNLYREDHPDAQRLFAFLKDRQAWKTEAPTTNQRADASKLEGLGYTGDDEDADENETQEEE